MAEAYELNLLELLRLHKKHPAILTNPAIIPKGSIVVCSATGWNDAANDVNYLGKVLRSGDEVKLIGKEGEPHPDGDTGEVFVQPYNRVTAIPKKKMPGTKMLIFHTTHNI